MTKTSVSLLVRGGLWWVTNSNTLQTTTTATTAENIMTCCCGGKRGPRRCRWSRPRRGRWWRRSCWTRGPPCRRWRRWGPPAARRTRTFVYCVVVVVVVVVVAAQSSAVGTCPNFSCFPSLVHSFATRSFSAAQREPHSEVGCLVGRFRPQVLIIRNILLAYTLL